MASYPSERTKVFISYSHQDAEFLQRLQVHLAPEVRNKRVDLWDDTMIAPGTKWQSAIDQALQTAKVAVLLVSADFLASDFIALNELPPLLSAAESEGVTILPVLLKPCSYKNTPLAAFQFVNKPLISLISMKSEAEREETWVRTAESITRALGPPPFSHILEHPYQGSQLHQGAQNPLDERYRKALLADSSLTKLQVLTMSSPLQISNIYVRLQVHEEIQQKYSARSKEEQAKDPLTLAQQQERFLEGRFRMAMEPADALRKYNQSVIVGDPGAGKTTLLKYLTIQSINKQFTDIPHIPIYIRLNAFAISGDSDLLTFVARTWEKGYGISSVDARTYIEERIASS